MPIDIASKRSEIARLTVDLGGEQAWIDYYPNSMTAEWLQDLITGQEDISKMCDLLTEVIHDWDIFDNGKKCEIESEAMRTWPMPLINVIVTGFMEDSQSRGSVVNRRGQTAKGGKLRTLFRDITERDDGEGPSGGEASS